MFRTINPSASPKAGWQMLAFRGPVRAAILVLPVLVIVAVARASSPQTDEAVAQLSQTIYKSQATPKESAGLQTEPAPPLYRAIYWLWAATRNDLSPEMALSVAGLRTTRPMSDPLKSQLLADWHIASVYGLLTPENLSRLQANTAPVATFGRFADHSIEAVKIEPDLLADLSNLAFCPSGFPLPADAQGHPPIASFPLSPVPVSSAPGAPSATKTERVELHEVAFNDPFPSARESASAVITSGGPELSVSVIGRGPKVKYGGVTSVHAQYFPRVVRTKVPKTNPIRLPGINGNAYLIDNETNARYYYVEDTFGNGSSYHIAKVTAAQ